MSRLYPLVAVLLTIFSPALAYAQTATTAPAPVEPPRTISVSGECVRQVTPDQGVVTATASYIDPTSVANASKTVMGQYETFRKAVQALGLKDLNIQTSDYSVTPIYNWMQPHANEPGKQVLQGYQARLGLSVKTSSIDKVGDVIAKAAEAGLQEVGGFQLTLSTALEQKIKNECLGEAVANARTKAAKMAESAGAKIGKVMSLSESFQGPVMPMVANVATMEAKMSMGSDGSVAAPTIQAGSAAIQVSVRANFLLE